ncbi:MAG: tetratricopeptide repeat protein [Burkholderiales bacterium]|nr:tetratricopeptide repeat protein [Burkholderiales bacterium]
MDALKKAEKAKQGPNSVFGTPEPAPTSGPATDWPVLSLDPKPTDLAAELGVAEPAKPQPRSPAAPSATPQPDLTMALEPLPDKTGVPDAPPPAPAVPAAPTAPPTAPTAAAAPSASRPSSTPSAVAADAGDRLAAKGVFAAKQGRSPASNPRLPFLATVAALLALGAGGAYYVWLQLQPPAPVASKSGTIGGAPPPAPPAAPASAPAAQPAPPAPAAATQAGPMPGTPATAAQGASPLPATAADASAAAQVAGAAATPPAAAVPKVPGAPRAAPGAPPAKPAGIASAGASPEPPPPAMTRNAGTLSARGGTPVDSPQNLRITRDRAPAAIDPAVQAGYAALADGQVEAAREQYARALANDPANRDAHLGMAAVALRSGRPDIAEQHYQRILERHPRDPYVGAQLSALRPAGDPVASESRLKAALAEERDIARAAPLQFSLGAQLATQGRWPEAQQAFFNAHVAEPDNPDYAYNLAVSLDHLRQPRLAHEHYAKALALAGKRRAAFDESGARARMEALAALLK